MTKKDLLCQLRDEDCYYFRIGPKAITPSGQAMHIVFHIRPGRNINPVVVAQLVDDIEFVLRTSEGGSRWTGWITGEDMPEIVEALRSTVKLTFTYEQLT